MRGPPCTQFLEANQLVKIVKAAAVGIRSAMMRIGSALGAFEDWIDRCRKQAVAVLVALCLGFVGTVIAKNPIDLMGSPQEAASPTTTSESPAAPAATTTKLVQVIQRPTQSEAPRSAEKETMVQTTEASQPSSQESSTPPSSTSPSASATPSAPSSSELPSSTTSASPTTTSAATPATSSSKGQ